MIFSSCRDQDKKGADTQLEQAKMHKELLSGINRIDFEGTIDGKTVNLYVLKNKNGIEELKGIRIDGDTITIGAMTTESELINSDILQQHCPLLIDAAKLVADPQVRNKGTIGGDVAHGDPGNDHPAVMLALDAQLVIHGPDGERTIPANGFFLGTYWTTLEEHEILVAIKIPPTRRVSFATIGSHSL